MTAPLNYRLEETDTIEKTLYNAIDEDNFQKIEKLISEILVNNRTTYISMFYDYAYTKNHTKTCEYLKQILLINNNICNLV